MGEILVRKAKESDFDFFYSIKCDEDNIYWTGHTSCPARDSLHDFFSSHVRNRDVLSGRTIFIVEEKSGCNRVGYLYLDPENSSSAEIGIAILQAFSGRGFGRQAIGELCSLAYGFGFRKIRAEVREDNLRSQRMFQHAGFEKTDQIRFGPIKEIRMIQYEKILRG